MSPCLTRVKAGFVTLCTSRRRLSPACDAVGTSFCRKLGIRPRDRVSFALLRAISFALIPFLVNLIIYEELEDCRHSSYLCASFSLFFVLLERRHYRCCAKENFSFTLLLIIYAQIEIYLYVYYSFDERIYLIFNNNDNELNNFFNPSPAMLDLESIVDFLIMNFRIIGRICKK